MATLIFNTQPINDTNANFRAWGGNISAFFTTAGWVKDLDSAQINWSTVVAPTGTSNSVGYEIWHMNDTLQATAPIFVKIEYGSGTALAQNPSLWFTLGANSDNAGTITSQTGQAPSTRLQLSSANGANSVSSYASGANNRICMCLWTAGGNASNNQMKTATGIVSFFAIERTKDSSGNDTNEGALLLFRNPASGAAVFRQQYWNAARGPTGVEADWGILYPSANLTTTTGVQTAVYPVYLNKGIYLNPGLNVLGYVSPTLWQDSPTLINFYGTNRTYMPIANNWGGTAISAQGRTQAAQAFAMLFE